MCSEVRDGAASGNAPEAIEKLTEGDNESIGKPDGDHRLPAAPDQTERPGRPVIDASISLAAAFGAHLDALAAGYVSTSTAYVVDGAAGAAVATVFELEQERATQRATRSAGGL
jgi:hypothetical protein